MPESIAIVRDWYTQDELRRVWMELDVICSPFILNDEKNTGSAKTDTGVLSKKGHGIFLDLLYDGRREVSNRLELTNKIFNLEFLKRLIDYDPVFRYFNISTADNTLVNYYEENDEYNTHFDYSLFTSNVVLWREPRKFNGGKFLLTEKELDFDLKSNDLIIFPGYMLHRVTKLEMHEDHTPWRSGRYSITNFTSFRQP